MIEFKNVTKKYGEDSHSLVDVTLNIVQGEFVSLVGHSGAGKTTMVRLILAEEKPTNGEVLFEEVNIHGLTASDVVRYRRRIGVVFQDFKLLPNKTAYENIAFAMEVAGRTDEEIKSDVPNVLDLVGLIDKIHRFPHQMSGGERQRLAIARAIINQPELLIADEPTGNLDPVNTYEIVKLLEKINNMGTTILLTTHNKGVVDSLGKRVVTLENGKIIRDENGGYNLK
ncbi:cell division ATP-binding protein FtsE [Candidatus Nomurabacteria bacterium]|nr:cell division ATP-binding protein FtsE [Candidatus Nomurabacteria bacterium]USN94482.1 MAG: cell division ATP-binding protein FtsE [Candidatus Nomurabacteria bacterium]